MRLLTALALAIAAPIITEAQQGPVSRAEQRSLRMTPEEAFFYSIAVYGYGHCTQYDAECEHMDNLVRYYTQQVDPRGLERPKTEFDVADYKNAQERRILEGARRASFTQRFLYMTEAMVESYDFAKSSFPIRIIDKTNSMAGEITQIHWPYLRIGGRDGEITVYPFQRKYAVNELDWDWSLSMNQADGRAFVESLPQRRVHLRVVYSITKTKAFARNTVYYLAPFIVSLEVLRPDGTKISDLRRVRASSPSSPEEWLATEGRRADSLRVPNLSRPEVVATPAAATEAPKRSPGSADREGAIDSAREAAFPVRYNSAIPGYMYMADGVVSVSKTAVTFAATYGYGNESFVVAPEKILEVELKPGRSSPLRVRVLVKNKKGNKETKRDYFFFSSGAKAVGGRQGGEGARLDCSACDDSMEKLRALLTTVRAGK